LTIQETITKTISEENLKLKSDIEKLSSVPQRIEDLESAILRNGLLNSFKELVKYSLHTIEIEEWKVMLNAIIEKKEADGTKKD